MAGFYTAALSKSQALHWPGLSPPSTHRVRQADVHAVFELPGGASETFEAAPAPVQRTGIVGIAQQREDALGAFRLAWPHMFGHILEGEHIPVLRPRVPGNEANDGESGFIDAIGRRHRGRVPARLPKVQLSRWSILRESG